MTPPDDAPPGDAPPGEGLGDAAPGDAAPAGTGIIRISSGSAYEPQAAYCRAVVVDGWVLVSGTAGNDHQTMQLPDRAEDQCALALAHIRTALATAGASFADVVRVRYILPDRADFAPCWPLLREAFAENPPAATMIEAGLIDPAMKIEIEVSARLPK